MLATLPSIGKERTAQVTAWVKAGGQDHALGDLNHHPAAPSGRPPTAAATT